MVTVYKKTGVSVKVNGLKKNVYMKVGTAKKYVTYKGKKMRLGKYKKMMKAKNGGAKKAGGAKKSKRRTVKK